MWVAGVDGCRAGWFAALLEPQSGRLEFRLAAKLGELMELRERPVVIAVDIPVGLLERAERGGRACDRAARRLLGRPRASSVYNPPVRPALREDYAAANRANRASSPLGLGLSRQSFGIAAKIREVDAVLTPAGQRRVHEAHPELAFRALNGQRPVNEPKRSLAGRRRRARLLARVAGFRGVPEIVRTHTRAGIAADDVLDALALAWTAQRIAVGEGSRVPERPQQDSHGLRMEIWF